MLSWCRLSLGKDFPCLGPEANSHVYYSHSLASGPGLADSRLVQAALFLGVQPCALTRGLWSTKVGLVANTD